MRKKFENQLRKCAEKFPAAFPKEVLGKVGRRAGSRFALSDEPLSAADLCDMWSIVDQFVEFERNPDASPVSIANMGIVLDEKLVEDAIFAAWSANFLTLDTVAAASTEMETAVDVDEEAVKGAIEAVSRALCSVESHAGPADGTESAFATPEVFASPAEDRVQAVCDLSFVSYTPIAAAPVADDSEPASAAPESRDLNCPSVPSEDGMPSELSSCLVLETPPPESPHPIFLSPDCDPAEKASASYTAPIYDRWNYEFGDLGMAYIDPENEQEPDEQPLDEESFESPEAVQSAMDIRRCEKYRHTLSALMELE